VYDKISGDVAAYIGSVLVDVFMSHCSGVDCLLPNIYIYIYIHIYICVCVCVCVSGCAHTRIGQSFENLFAR